MNDNHAQEAQEAQLAAKAVAVAWVHALTLADPGGRGAMRARADAVGLGADPRALASETRVADAHRTLSADAMAMTVVAKEMQAFTMGAAAVVARVATAVGVATMTGATVVVVVVIAVDANAKADESRPAIIVKAAEAHAIPSAAGMTTAIGEPTRTRRRS